MNGSTLDSSQNSYSALADVEEEQEVETRPPSSPPRRLPQKPLVWIDLEMTGLDIGVDTILQIACIITDGSLENVIEGEEIAIHHPDSVLEGMNEWCKEHHGKSGLTQAVRSSSVSLAQAERRVLTFIRKHIPNHKIGIIAGNSVHVDVAFLKKYMPTLINYLHYRIVDVSTVGELCKRWFPQDFARGPKKSNAHTAMSDIRESIAQLKYYKKTVFKQK